MATSGTATFNRTRDQILSRAARLIGAIRAGSTMGAQVQSDFAEALNAMVKRWQATGIHVWGVTEATLFLIEGQEDYALGSTSTDHATLSFVETTLSADAASGASTVSVTSASGLAASQYLGIELDSGNYQWTTISNLSGTTVTPAAALTGAATSGNRVLAYTTKLVRPLRVLSARRYNFDSDIDTPLFELTRKEYYDLPNKSNAGSVTQYFYEPRGGANANGLLHVWQSPDSEEYAIKMTVWRPIEDFSAAGNDPDFPVEWIDALTFNLAMTMAPEYDVPDSKFTKIAGLAQKYLDDVTWDSEPEYVTFMPEN